MFHWIRQLRRKRLLDGGLEANERLQLERLVWQYPELSRAQQHQLEGWMRVLIAEKHWETVDGLQLSREMQLSIAGQAGLLCLGFPDFYFDRMATIIIRKNPYLVRESIPLGTGGHVLVAPGKREGEAWKDGPVVLSWSEVSAGGREWNEGNNLVMHEFAHQLDTSFDGIADGNPGLSGLEKKRWDDVFAAAEERLLEANRSNRYSVLDPYGLTNRAELFSVSVEAFFQHGDWLKEAEGELYDLLRDFFRIETAQWGPAPGRYTG